MGTCLKCGRSNGKAGGDNSLCGNVIPEEQTLIKTVRKW